MGGKEGGLISAIGWARDMGRGGGGGGGWRKEARKGRGMNHQGQDRTRQRIQALVSAAQLHLLSRPLLGSLLTASATALAGRYNSHALAYRSSLKNRKRPLCLVREPVWPSGKALGW